MINNSDFGKRLQKIIEFYGLSATIFAEKLEVNRSTISHLLSGRNKPSLDFVLKVLHHFPEVELYWLLNGKGIFPLKNQSNKLTTPTFDKSWNTKETTISSQHINTNSLDDDEIDKIVIFYKNGTFKAYKN